MTLHKSKIIKRIRYQPKKHAYYLGIKKRD
jgi:hypothetical protein